MRKLIIALVMGTALLPFDGFTLGLGGIEVNSALNQELDAEIELLSAAPEDAETLIVKLASREEFNRAGLDRPFSLQSLKFGNTVKNGVPYITVTTSKPVREPFLNFLVEVDWPKGHLLREYTILLDPPVFMGQDGSRPSVSDSGGRPSAADESGSDSYRPAVGGAVAVPAAVSGPASRQSSGTAPAPATGASYAPTPAGDYRIKKGDTAWSLADSLRPDQSVSVEQMMLAMLRTNPESFINDNINGLKRGYILRIPDRNEITSMTQAEAVALVRQQNALWREYQQAVSSGQPASSLGKTGAAGGAGAAGDTDNARLSIVSAGKGAASGSAGNIDGMSVDELRAQLALAEERLEAERVEKESLQGEVESLEQQVSRMKRLLNIEDSGLAEMQSTATGTESAPEEVYDEITGELITGEAPFEAAPTEAGTEEEGVLPAEEAATETEEPAGLPADTETESVFVDEQPETETSPAETAPAVAEQETAPVEQPYTNDYIQPQQQGFIENLLNNPLILAAAGGGLLLIMALVYMLVKRRRNTMEFVEPAMVSSTFGDDEDDLASVADMIDDKAVSQHVSDEEVEQSMAAAEEEAEKFDSDATLILPSVEDTIITHAEPHEEEARDDIIAEADVYLAYGIYQQAEELLQNAINEHPENDAYRMKLAETHYASKNASAFGQLATEMKQRTGGNGPGWQKIVAMGKDLMPDNALFKDAQMVGDMALDDLVPSPEPTMDFDLGAEASTEPAAPDLDFSLDDDSSLELPEADMNDTAILSLEDEEEASPAAPTASEEELEFDLSEAEAVKDEAEAAADEEEFSLDIEASELDITTDKAGEETESVDLDFDMDLSAEAEEAAEEETKPAADDGGLDFDIDLSEEISEVAETEAAPETETLALADDEGDIDLSELDDVDEVSTKLDLARAYLDMGDQEGTRSILEEVIAEGNDEQKAEAEGLLAEING